MLWRNYFMTTIHSREKALLEAHDWVRSRNVIELLWWGRSFYLIVQIDAIDLSGFLPYMLVVSYHASVHPVGNSTRRKLNDWHIFRRMWGYVVLALRWEDKSDLHSEHCDTEKHQPDLVSTEYISWGANVKYGNFVSWCIRSILNKTSSGVEIFGSHDLTRNKLASAQSHTNSFYYRSQKPVAKIRTYLWCCLQNFIQSR